MGPIGDLTSSTFLDTGVRILARLQEQATEATGQTDIICIHHRYDRHHTSTSHPIFFLLSDPNFYKPHHTPSSTTTTTLHPYSPTSPFSFPF